MPRRVADRRTSTYPLSPGQRQMWLFDQMNPHSAVSTFTFWIRLRGSLCHSALTRAVTDLQARHDALRTVVDLGAADSVAAARVCAPAAVDLPERDLSGGPDPVGQAEALAHRAARTPFRLDRELPVRWQLLHLGTDDHVLLLGIHHIAADGWSEAVINHELGVLYAEHRDARARTALPQPARYESYARARTDRDHTADLRYWTAHLDGAPAATALPFDRAPQRDSRSNGTVEHSHVTATLTAAVERLARSERASPFMVLLAAVTVALTASRDRSDLVVGLPVADRFRPEFESTVGYFVNTLPVRVRPRGELSFRQFVAQVRDTTLDAFAHRAVPLERIVEAVGPARPVGRQPLVQVTVQVHNTPSAALKLPGLEVEQRQLFGDTSTLDLAIAFLPADDGMRTMWEYRSDLFDAATIRRLDATVLQVLTEATADPARAVRDLGRLAPDAPDPLVAAARGKRVRHCAGLVHEMIEQTAKRVPDRIAVTDASGAVTYRELDERANRLAHALRERGVGPETLVGLLAPRSTDLVVAVLAVLKAGGGYLPLDPSLPDRRLAGIVADARPLLVIGTEDLLRTRRGAVDDYASTYSVTDPAMRHQPGSPLPGRVHPDGVAYVMYTSGSTGRPKGVVVPHRGLANYVAWASRTYDPGPDARTGYGSLLHSSAGFDLSVTALFVPLVAGRAVGLMPEGWRLPDLADELTAATDLAIAKLTPTHLAALRTELADPDGRLAPRVRGVRTFVLGGEALRHDLVAAWRQIAPDARIVNEYGPTETVVGCSWLEVGAGTGAGTSVPLGTAVDNTDMYALDPDLLPSPVGTIGEIYVGGVQVTRGYLGMPRATAEQFVPDHLGATAGGRLYRTGDLARVLAPGVYEFAGRVDHEVKLRGHRIALEEVTAALLAHPDVTDAVAVVRHGGTERALIAAYYVATRPVEPGELRRLAAEQLPTFMLPSHCRQLSELPRTDNCKIDTDALPTPEGVVDRAATAAPTTRTQRRLTAVWSEVLGVERIGVDDDFFEIGGQSLLAARVAARFRSAHPDIDGTHLLADLLAHPTVRGTAAAIDRRAATSGSRHRPDPRSDIAPVPADGPQPLSDAQIGVWLSDQLAPGSRDFLVPRVWRLRGPLDVAALAGAVRQVAERHRVLRTCVHLVDDAPVGVVVPAAAVPVTTEMVAVDGLAARIERECTTAIDLTAAPPLRAAVVRVGDGDHLLLLTCHHIATDGLSGAVLARDLGRAYRAAFAGGSDAPVPAPLPMQFADVVARAAQATPDNGMMANRLAHWRRVLAGVPPLRPPLDRQRPRRRSGAGGVERVRLPDGMVEGLANAARSAGTTLFTAVLAAFGIVLSEWSGQERFTVATPVSSRPDGTDDLVGLFVTMLVLPVWVPDGIPLRRLLEDTRRTIVEALAHQDVPYDRLVRELRPDRTPGGALFSVSLDVDDSGPTLPELPGIAVTSYEPPVMTSKYDLAVSLTRHADAWTGEFNYDSDLFEPATIAALGNRFAAVLADIAERIGESGAPGPSAL